MEAQGWRLRGLAIVGGVALALGLNWAPAMTNALNVVALRALLGGESSGTLGRTLLDQSTAGERTVLPELASIALDGEVGRDRVEMWLRRRLPAASRDDVRTLSLQIEGQAERWARQGRTVEARTAFSLLNDLNLPYPEPYARMGEFAYATTFDIGIPFPEAFARAAAAAASSPHDDAFKSIAQTRLCEYVLRNGGPDDVAESHCREAIRLDNGHRGYTAWHMPLAQILLGEALAKQCRYAEAEATLRHAVEVAPERNYAAMAWYDLGAFVFEPQALDDLALEAYRTAIRLAPVSWGDSARLRIAGLCAARPTAACRGGP